MKAIALISGGLDSILAAKLLKQEGIDIIPLYFKIPFFYSRQNGPAEQNLIPQILKHLGAELKIIDAGDEFLRILEDPVHGYGSNMNPCIDCKIMMLCKAKELMEEFKAKFIVTGEVLGQRPMSQHKPALNLIERRAGLQGLILRPLSARRLAETLPEKEGWVSRDKLLDFSGRTRKPQIELAKRLNIEDYPNPAGGCLLTDPAFSKRVKDLINHRELNSDNVELLKVGRHFRIQEQTKLVVGRNENENKQLVNLAKDNDYLFEPTEEIAGPTALGRGIFDSALIGLSCNIVCRYCDLNDNKNTEIVYKKIPEEQNKRLEVLVIEERYLWSLRI